MGDEMARRESNRTKGPNADRRVRGWRLPEPWLGIIRRRDVQIIFAVACVALLLGTSAPQPSGPTNSRKTTDAAPYPSEPAVPYTPYLVNASEFPLPETLLNNSSGVYDPQFTTTEFQNQTIYELAYGQSTPAASGLAATTSIQYLDGRYDPSEAVCILNRTSCGANVSHLPIYWGAPWKVYGLGSTAVLQGVALGSSGGLVATAFSTNNRTRLLYTTNFGQSLGWTDPTPTTVPGIQPKLSVSPTAIDLTTVSPTGGVYATVFHLPGLPATPIAVGGGSHPLIPTPTVTSISPYYGPPSTTVNIYGTNFLSVTAVTFGTHAASSYTVLSPTHIQATAPSYTSSSPVNVTVTSGGTSATDYPYDWFTISSTAPQPQIFSVIPNNALPNSTVSITGYAFAPAQYVTFGSASALSYAYTNETYFTAVVPWGTGGPTVVQVQALGQNSILSSSDHFTFAVFQSILPRAVDASPLQLSNGATGSSIFGVFETNTNSSSTSLYNSTNGGGSYSGTSLASFSTSPGSSIFSQIGSTRLYLGGGIPGQVASVGYGQTIFGLFTSNVGNRTVVETEGTSNGGQTWTGPYYTAPLLGSVESPYATISPAGLVYVVWLDNGAGPWQVDQAIYSESGRLLLGPQTISGSGGPSGYSALTPSVAVDGLDRPLYVWGWTNEPACGFCAYLKPANVSISATGAYLNASTAAVELSNAFHRTSSMNFVASDFLWPTSQSANLTPFENKVNARIGWVQANLSASKPTCTLQQLALRYILPNVSSLKAVAPFFGVSGHCSISPAATATQIANLSGPTSANSYLGVYADWLLESLGYGSLKEPYWAGAPAQAQLLRNYKLTPPPLHLPPDQPTNVTATNWHVSVTPASLNPNSIYLNVSGFFGTIQQGGSAWCNLNRTERISNFYDDYPTWENETVKIHQLTGGSYSGTFHPSAALSSVYVTGLPSGFWGSYNVTLNVTYTEYHSEYNGCEPGNSSQNFQSRLVTPFTMTPRFLNLSLVGNMTTYMEGVPADLVVHDTGNTTGGNSTIYAAWNNSVLGNYTEWTNATGATKKLVSNPDAFAESTGKISVAANKWYNTTASLVSVPGGYNATGWTPRLNTGLSGNSTPERFNASSPWTCTFHLPSTNPLHIYSNGGAVTDVTTSNATLTWWSNLDGTGWVTFNDSDDGSFMLQAQKVNLTMHLGLVPNASAPIMYRVQLQGLTPWALYRATLGVSGNGSGTFSGGGSCLTFSNTVQWHFHTLSLFTLSEQDFPYDSISQQGGGAQFRWSIPSAFAASANYTSGSMIYCQWWTNRTPAQRGPGTNVTIPLPTLNAELAGSNFALTQVNSSFVLNTTGLTINTQYNVTLYLNFTYLGVPFNASSRPLLFWYEKDTSGDGLTDWEKLHGWEVTTQSATGSWNSPQWVTANPNLYATNGLVNDYVEKEFGLNPQTVDTAGSHMLDTWNLTFDLGGKSHPLRIPSNANFEYWYEEGNSSVDYNPNKACQYFVTPGSTCSKGKVATNLTNISGADNSAWASRVLWNKSALWTFLNMSGVRNASWLRATLGNTTTDWTITIEGKLSWGANPLATSTPSDGVADGARVNPLYDEDLVISSVSSNIFNSKSLGCPYAGGGSSYFGWAPLFYLNYTIGGTSYSELPTSGNYTRQTNDGNGSSTNGGICGSLSSWQTAIPIVGTTQNQTIQARLVLHYTPSGKDQLWAEKFNTTTGGSQKKATIVYDTVAGTTSTTANPGCSARATCQFTGTNGTLNLSLSVMPAGVKDPVDLWLPTDNGTLNNLPWGLKRYTGEQAFDLLEIDQTSGGPLTSHTIPYAQNGSRSYSLTLSSGLNSFLIPRGEFLYSALGQGILLGKNSYWNATNVAPAILNSTENSTLHSAFARTNGLQNLGCYWQNRSVGTGSSNLSGVNCTAEQGTSLASSYNIQTVNTTANGSNTGGVPGNPSLETSSEAGAALQTVLTLNISSVTELDYLLAGLMDNGTGGINGTFLPVTYEVPSLALNPVVVRALANATFNSSGLFGEPTSHWVAPPPPPCSGLFCWASNLVSGIVKVGSGFFSFVWSATIALATFVDDHLPTWLRNLGAEIVSRAASYLSIAGALLASAFSQLLNVVIGEVRTSLESTVTPGKNAVNHGAAGTINDLVKASGDVQNGSQSNATKLAPDEGAQALPIILTLTAIAGTVLVVTLVLQLLSAGMVTIVTSILLSLILSLILIHLTIVSHGTISLGTAVWWADNMENCTSLNTYSFSCPVGSTLQQLAQPAWAGAAALFSDKGYVGLFFTLLTTLATFALTNTIALTLALTLSLFGVFFTLYGIEVPSSLPYTSVLSGIVDFLSLYFDIQALRGGVSSVAGGVVAGVSIGLDEGSLIADGTVG